jgi:serine/threonine protein phosphatase PrpC
MISFVDSSVGEKLRAPVHRVAVATLVEDARPGRGEDRIALVALNDRTVIVVADGAGGQARGAGAADYVCRALDGLRQQGAAPLWSAWLRQLDQAMAASGACGLAAAVVVEIGDDGAVAGASVGDCEAWIVGDGEPRSLTARQIRKPLLGDGGAMPLDFSARISGGTLVAGSDGLWKYTTLQRIIEAAKCRPLQAATTALVDSVRLRSGALQDDVAVVVCG